MNDQAVSVSWQTDVMPVPAFNYFHKECYEQVAYKQPILANQQVREINASEVGSNVICVGCWRRIKNNS